jgi:hypothetical protein
LYTHSLDDSIREAGPRESMLNADLRIGLEWGKMSAWRIESRYRLGVSEADAAEFVRVIADRQGTLAWLTTVLVVADLAADLIAAGRTLPRKLDAQGVRFDAAFWLMDPENSSWRLHLGAS